MLDYGTSGGTTPSGVTLENSVFVAPGDLWNPNRAMETVGSPLSIENNVFAGFLDHTESASCNHIDTLQLYAGSNSTDGNVTFTGNLCYDDYNCFAAWDGTSDNTITDNACFDIERNCIDLYSDTGSVVNHNTQELGVPIPPDVATYLTPLAPVRRCSRTATSPAIARQRPNVNEKSPSAWSQRGVGLSHHEHEQHVVRCECSEHQRNRHVRRR